MSRHGKLDLEKILKSLNVTCPHCNASITPAQQTRIDFERMKCPHCGETFVPKG